MTKIYVASSWRNRYQPEVVEALRFMGCEVYDFRNPFPNSGFSWNEISPDWKSWTITESVEALNHEKAIAGFNSDVFALRSASAVVLVLPSGRSAHLEAGWAVGQGKGLFIYSPEANEPELMYKWATFMSDKLYEVCFRAATWLSL